MCSSLFLVKQERSLLSILRNHTSQLYLLGKNHFITRAPPVAAVSVLGFIQFVFIAIDHGAPCHAA